MRTPLLLLLVGLGAASAQAAEPAGQAGGQVTVHWQAGAGFGAFVDLSRNHEATGVGRHIGEARAAGLAWQWGGFRAAASAGQFAYDFTGAGTGTARLAAVALSHEVVTTAGTLSLELRRSRLWEGESQLDMTSARLGWSLKF